jgi:ssDNA-binding Zn-finger/Zn-ribbon topoisomerase 1
MKPTRNRVMCPDCGKAKMLFESEKKAKRFIEWNG